MSCAIAIGAMRQSALVVVRTRVSFMRYLPAFLCPKHRCAMPSRAWTASVRPSCVEGAAILRQPADLDLFARLEAALIGGVAGLDDEILVAGDAQAGAVDVAHVDELQHLG